MIKYIAILFSFILVVSCGSTKNASKDKKTSDGPSVFEDQYYQDLGKNIVRLHQLMQGTFIAHSEATDEKLKQWDVSGGDSVVLYIAPLGEVSRNGYWTFSYEFMTSLPDDPIYTSIKQIKAISRDSFQILYYKTPTKMSLKEVLDDAVLNEKIEIEKLVAIDKKTLYVKKTASNFLGSSIMYEDKQCRCLRQNNYDVDPKFYRVQANYYDKETKEKLDKKKRPNLLVRRDMGMNLLNKIASKEEEGKK